MEILMKKIKNEVLKILDLNKVDDIFYMHFVVAKTIRNKFLYNNLSNIKSLNKIYSSDNIDDLSMLILEDIIKSLKS